MTSEGSLSTAVREIIRKDGEAALLNDSFVMALFLDMAPGAKKEKELLRLFLQCGGMKELLQVKQEVHQHKNCMERISRNLQDTYGIAEDAAQYVCAEVYQGITGQTWKWEPAGSARTLDIWKTLTVTNTDCQSSKSVPVSAGSQQVNVQLRPDAKDGQTICFKNKGLVDVSTGQTGDLYITIHIHPAFCAGNWKIYAAVAAAVILLAACFLPGSLKRKGGEGTDNTLPTQAHQQDSAENTERNQEPDEDVAVAPPIVVTVPPETVHEHSWVDASYSAPRTCRGCGMTTGLSLGTPLAKCNVLSDSQCIEGTDITTGTVTDVAGVQHESSVMLWVNAGRNYEDSEYVTYELDGRYTELSGVIAVGKKSNQKAAIRFYIYGDDNLIYTSSYIRGTETDTFRLDVTNIRELRVECDTDEACHGYGILDALLFVG